MVLDKCPVRHWHIRAGTRHDEAIWFACEGQTTQAAQARRPGVHDRTKSMRNAERVLPDSPYDGRKQFCLTTGTSAETRHADNLRTSVSDENLTARHILQDE